MCRIRSSLGCLVLLLLAAGPLPGISADRGSPAHHTSTGFRNPYNDEASSSRFFTYIRARFFGDEPFAEYTGKAHLVPQRQADLPTLLHPQAERAQVTWVGHSTTLIQYRGYNILTDPILSQRASPLSFAGPRRYTQPALSMAQLPRIDFVVISHNHYDHLDAETVTAIGDRAVWLVPLGLKQWFLDRGVPADRVVELDWWEQRTFGDATFVATPAQHFSGRSLWDYMETLWSSWVIRVHELDVWFGGDTGYNPVQFKKIGERHGPFELGLIPIGAFEPRWFMKPMHVNPAEALRLHNDVRAERSIGIHWGTFRLAAEEIDQPMRELERAARATGAAFTTIAIGETLELELSSGSRAALQADDPERRTPLGSGTGS